MPEIKSPLTLGQRLKQRLAAEEQNALERLQRESREKGEKALEELAVVQAFFTTAQQAITKAIDEERAIPKIKLGGRENMLAYQHLAAYRWTQPPGNSLAKVGVQLQSHQYFPVWESFEAWATSNELKVGWDYQYDGGGMDSWYVLTVKPLIRR